MDRAEFKQKRQVGAIKASGGRRSLESATAPVIIPSLSRWFSAKMIR